MKTLLLLALFGLLATSLSAQTLCFEDPNTGAIYHNGSLAIYDITTGDFNGDGHLDLVTANSIGGNISFIPGYGNGTLGAPDTISVPSVLFGITSADYNNDGELDVVTVNGANIFVLLGNGDGTFQPYQTYTAGGLPSRIYSKDINFDNITDLLVASSAGVYVAIGQASGEFLTPILYGVNGGCIDITPADFDGDQITDLVSVTHLSWVTSELSFLKGIGDGTFELSGSTPVPHHSIFGINSTDIDGNGSSDLIVSNSNNTINRIEIYTGNGDGTFNTPIFYPTFYAPVYLYLVDVNNDLIQDVLIPEGSGYSILTGNSDGTFNDFQYFVITSSVNGIAIGDYNEDNKVDFAVPSGDIGYIHLQLNCSIEIGVEAPYPIDHNDINIYPNPVGKSFTLRSTQKNDLSYIEILDCAGRVVYAQQGITDQEIIVDGHNLSDGLYFVRFTHAHKVLSTQKITVLN